MFIASASHFLSPWKQWQKRSGYHVHMQKKIRIRNLRFRKIDFRERFRKAPLWGSSVFKKLRIRADTFDRFYVSGVEKLIFRKDPGLRVDVALISDLRTEGTWSRPCIRSLDLVNGVKFSRDLPVCVDCLFFILLWKAQRKHSNPKKGRSSTASMDLLHSRKVAAANVLQNRKRTCQLSTNHVRLLPRYSVVIRPSGTIPHHR